MKDEQFCSKVHIYIDECGTPDLDTLKSGNQEFSIYSAVIIGDKDINNANHIYNKIIEDDFNQQKYIKSSQIGNDKSGYAKTISALTTLKELNHYVYALIIDKKHLQGHKGLSIKDIFIKFIQRLLAEHFYDKFDEFHIYADETGHSEFKLSLEKYMQNIVGLAPTLFSNNTFKYVNDKDCKLIQIADLYAGTIGKYLCGKYDVNRGKVVHDIIRTRLSIQWFPNEFVPYIIATNSFNTTFDNELFNLAKKTSTEYIESHNHDISGCELINYMLQEAQYNPLRHISSKELKERLNFKNIEIGDPIVKVSELRNNGVLIISPIGKKGYKFPTSEKGIAEFYNRLSANIIPQLKRGYILNEVLAQRSIGKYNILKDVRFEKLNALSEVVNKG